MGSRARAQSFGAKLSSLGFGFTNLVEENNHHRLELLLLAAKNQTTPRFSRV
jgi:hypothetical protein